jgi:ketosteroid isomerase-like protein
MQSNILYQIFSQIINSIKMEKTLKRTLLLGACLLFGFVATAQTKSVSTVKSSYNSAVVENPNADADIKVVSDFLHSLVAGDMVKAKSLMTTTYKGYGPSSVDSLTGEQTTSNWEQANKIRTNKKIGQDLKHATFRVKTGVTKGDWVAVWGDYSFTQMEKNITVPFQFTAHVVNGKIDYSKIYYDNMHVAQLLGYKMTPPESKE